ncbi:MAG: hypothetical protein JXB24_10980 [Bacteroidales bacterium]|nr:hypothetical protein [Bacteroidales bacterium]
MKKFSMLSVLLICLILSIQCFNKKKPNLTIGFIIGQYACLDRDSSYTEIYITNSNILFHTDIGRIGPYDLVLKNGKITFNDITYSIEQKDCYHLIFRNQENEFLLEKIDTSKFICGPLKINPFSFRHCYFLAKNGLMTIEEAIDFMQELKEPVEVKDEDLIVIPR